MLNITDIRIRLLDKEDSKRKAIASITIDGCFVIHEIRVIEGKEGNCFVAMPSRKAPDGEFRDIAHPVDQATRSDLDARILEAYEKAKAEAGNKDEAN